MIAPPAYSDQPLFLQLGDGFVDAWLGVPFRWDGRDRHGVDCWGLAVKFFAAVHARDLPDWRRRDASRAWIARTMAGEAREHWAPLAGPQNGCLVMARAGGIAPHHVGMFWRGSILHAAEGRGVILDRAVDFDTLHPGAEFGDYVP